MREIALIAIPLALAAAAAPAQQLPPSPGPLPTFTPGVLPTPELPGPSLTLPDPPAGEWPTPAQGTTPAPPAPTVSLGARIFAPSERALRQEQDLGWQASTLLAPQMTGRNADGSPAAPEQMPNGQPMVASLLRQARAQGYVAQTGSAQAPTATPRETVRAPSPVPFFESAAAVAEATSTPPTAPAVAGPPPVASAAALTTAAATPKPAPLAMSAGHLTFTGWLLLALALGAAGAGAGAVTLWRRPA